MQEPVKSPLVAIACGGTGGHLFPGMAVGEALQERGCDVTLLISAKDVDQWGARSAQALEVVTLPAVALSRGGLLAFLRGGWRAYRRAKALFAARPPAAVLAMGSFTSAPPVLAGRTVGAATFLHEANSIPGRANRWLAHVVDEAFVYFPECAPRLRAPSVVVTGMPVRNQFGRQEAGACRAMLGLEAGQPVLLVMGGSQGASPINDLMIHSLPVLAELAPNLQYLHLTGPKDEARVRAAYAAAQRKAVVRALLTEMEVALNAATAAVSRAGASSIAELAAVGLPALLIPYPRAAGNHQFYNALALVKAGAARMMSQRIANPGNLADLVLELTGNPDGRQALLAALARWHRADAAGAIADHILAAVRRGGVKVAGNSATVGPDSTAGLLARPPRLENHS